MLGVALKLPESAGLADCLFPLVTVRESCSLVALEKAIGKVASLTLPFQAEASGSADSGSIRLELGRVGLEGVLGRIRGSMRYVAKSAAPVVEMPIPAGKIARVQKAHSFTAAGLTVTQDGRPVSFHAFMGKEGEEEAPAEVSTLVVAALGDLALTCKLLAGTTGTKADEPAADEAPAEERFIMGVVLTPDIVDGQGDTYNEKEVRDACHFFMEQHQNIDIQHSFVATEGVFVIECFIAPVAFELGGREVKKGTWLMAVRVVDDKIWSDVKLGKFTGFSIGGRAVPKPVEPEQKRHTQAA